jgi:thiamine biosynthesis protein ThiS
MIEVNGREEEWKKDESVEDLLKRLNYKFPIIVVKINGKVVPNRDFSKTKIPNDSRIEIVPIVSGG